MPHPVAKWIGDRVAGKTFADIGGIGVGAGNERISAALDAGAKSATMIDLRNFDHPDWQRFDDLMKEKGIRGYHRVEKANLEDRGFARQVGTFEVVHSTGILYHTPSPVLAMHQLANMTTEYLITNTVIIPPSIANAVGTLQIDGAQATFLPGLGAVERDVLQEYFRQKLGWTPEKFRANIPALNDPDPVMPYIQREVPKSLFLWRGIGDLSYSPYWWLFTQQAFEALISLFNFEIIDTYWYKQHAMTVLCARRDQR